MSMISCDMRYGRSDEQKRALSACHSACNIDPLSRGIGVQN
jgi:hypothetical protein